MSFVSFPTDPNIMNDSELLQLKENYANMIVDGMDMDDMCQMCFDMLMDAYKIVVRKRLRKRLLTSMMRKC
jgi:hypothetical protein